MKLKKAKTHMINLSISIENKDDFLSFATKVSKIPEFNKLSYYEKLQILFSYPIVMKIV